MRKKISYCVFFNDDRGGYVVVTFTDGTTETRYPGEKGFESAKKMATASKKRPVFQITSPWKKA